MTQAEPGAVAVVGAGVAGLACARRLAEAGVPVTVFDKSRGPSGRLSTRRRADGQWDHGAPFFSATEPAFERQCLAWREAGVLARWPDDRHWVGVPRMSALGRHLALGLDLRTTHRIAQVQRTADTWTLLDTDGRQHRGFARVVVAVPAPQAVPLLAAVPSLQAVVRTVRPHPVHALLVRTTDDLSELAPVLRPDHGPLELIVHNTAKPGRPDPPCLVAHTRPSWTRSVLEVDPTTLADRLLEALAQALGRPVAPLSVQVHRWRYAHASGARPWPAGFGWSSRAGVGVCGDWVGGVGVEGAWRSGTALAAAMRGHPGASK